MGWLSSAWDFIGSAFENEAVSSVASAAASAAATYAMAEMLTDNADISTPLASIGTIAEEKEPGSTVADAAQKAEDEARSRRGHAATILTGPQGLFDEDVDIKRSTLLGG